MQHPCSINNFIGNNFLTNRFGHHGDNLMKHMLDKDFGKSIYSLAYGKEDKLNLYTAVPPPTFTSSNEKSLARLA